VLKPNEMKTYTEAEFRTLLNDWNNSKFSFSRMVEIVNERLSSTQEKQPESEMKDNLVRQVRVGVMLDNMMQSDMELYEKILNTTGFAFEFNNLVTLAGKDTQYSSTENRQQITEGKG